jgi:hypothetical protein
VQTKGESIDAGEGVGPSNSTDEAVIISRGGKGMGQSTNSTSQLGDQEELLLNVYG